MSAVTCHFERRNCHHATLFQSEYKRTNRTKKTKILRCFPHCCPEHLNRSYCGASLCVRVELVTPTQQTTTTTSNPASLLVFAHFEEAQTHLLSLNDVVDVDDVTGSVQTEQTPKGTWVQGAAIRDVAVDHSCLFQINAGARWYYEWESAATKAQRFTKHALRVYVFQQVQSQLRVVGLVSSSEFMVVSYRRAPSEVRAEREALEALRVPVTTQLGADTEDYNHVDAQATISTEHLASTVHSSQQVEGREEELWQDRKLWECRHPDVMTSSKQLAVLYYFLCHLNASSFLACLDQLSILFRDQVASYRSATGKTRGEDNHTVKDAEPPLSWAFLEPLGRVNSDTNRFDDGGEMGEGGRDPLARLAQICTNLAGWLALDSANLEMYRRFLRSYGAALLDKSRARAGYVEAVKLMCKLVDRFTGWSEDPSGSTSTSLSLLSEEIMTAVFKYDRLKPLRRVLLGVLTSNTMIGMHKFVAQLRAQYLSQQVHTLPTHNVLAREDNQESVFDGVWFFDGRRSSLTPIQGSPASDIPLGCLLSFMRELARVTIRAVGGQSLEVCSEWNVCGVQPGQATSPRSTEAGTLLVLDSRQRIFSNFPSGLSSIISLGAHSYGDYRGKIMSSSSFVVEMSSWPLDSSGAHPALRWKLQIDVESSDQTPNCLVVKAVVEEGYWRIEGNTEAADFQTMPFSLKHQTVKAWYPTYEVVGVYNQHL